MTKLEARQESRQALGCRVREVSPISSLLTKGKSMDLFGLKKKRYWDEIFSNCDLEFAKDLVVHTFAGGVITDDLVRLLNSYTNNPCRENAIALIEFDRQEFTKFFSDNKIALESMMRTRGLSREELSKTLRKNVALLHQEPEFEAYCEAFLEDDPIPIQKEKKAALIKKGYTKEMISEAFSEHMKDMAEL